MQRYLEQLIQDIRKNTWRLRSPDELWLASEADPDNELELEDLSYVEKYVYGEEIPVSQITGIDPEYLPTPEMLTDDQKALLSAELEKMLEVFHFILDFPADYPMYSRYSFIRNFWNEKHVPLSFGESHIEFCVYDQNSCPFPGYCTICDEVAKQMHYDNNPENQDDYSGDMPDWVNEDNPE
jgi:hypothetical protein